MKPEEASDDMLMALADGELGAQEAAELRRVIAEDAQTRARFEQFARSRRAAQSALRAIGEAPAPARLVHAIRAHGAGARSISDALRARGIKRVIQSAWALPAAAALTIAVVGFGAYRLGAMQGAPLSSAIAAGAPVADETMAAALSRVASEQAETLRDGRRMRVLATYRLAHGGLCRAFEIADGAGRATDALACRDAREESAWRTEIVVSGPAPSEDGAYLPASPGTLATIENYLDAHDAVRLEPEEEARLIARRWNALE